MAHLYHTAAQYWSFFDVWNNQQARKTPNDLRTIQRLKTLALIAEDRQSR